METILNSLCVDKIISTTFIIALITNLILDNKENSEIHELKIICRELKLKNKNYIYLIICFFLIPFVEIAATIMILKKQKYYTLGLLVIAFMIFLVYKFVKIINKKTFNRKFFSRKEKYIVTFFNAFYITLFSKEIYLMIINYLNTLNNHFISHFIMLTYMTIKLCLLMFLSIANLTSIFKNIYKLFFPNLYNFLLKLKTRINSNQITFEITAENKLKFFLNDKELNPKYLFFIKNLPIFLSIFIFSIIFYVIEIIKEILILIINVFIIPLTLAKKKLRNEFVFIYTLLYSCVFFSTSFIYFFALNNNTFDANSLKFFEFSGITVMITITMQRITDANNYEQ